MSENIDNYVLQEVSYFNVEVSACSTTLSFNASKPGIAAFLALYGKLAKPPEIIDLRPFCRPQRCWKSWGVRKNEELQPTDLTLYKGSWNDSRNQIADCLRFQPLEENHDASILCAGIRAGNVLLTVNQRGWNQFLDILHCLHDRSDWFYVTALNIPRADIPFALTQPYRGDVKDHILEAIECIRLEPEEQSYICIDSLLGGLPSFNETNPDYFIGRLDISGNCKGLLLLSQLMHNFSTSEELSIDFLNQWQNFPESPEKEFCFGLSDKAPHPPIWCYLRKTMLDFPHPVFSFEANVCGEPALYIFGNSKGFAELAKAFEEFAFLWDDDQFAEFDLKRFSNPRYSPLPYSPAESTFGSGNTRSFQGWGLLGGTFCNSKYRPSKFCKDRHILSQNFVNDRIIVS